MKISFFSKSVLIIFLFGGLSVNAQVRVNSDKSRSKTVIKKNRTNTSNRGAVRVKDSNRGSNYYNRGSNSTIKNTRSNYYNRGAVRVNNRNRVVVNKPNRPRVIVSRPNYNRVGYVWTEGYWVWNNFYGQYTWQKAKWRKIKRNHYWVPGFWEITLGGFFWVEGYWELEF